MSHTVFVVAFVAGMFTLITALGWITGIRRRERLRCPNTRERVDVDFRRGLSLTWSPGKAHDVARCTAFDDPDHVECDKACMNA